jgi:hypothetical protein
VIRPVPRDDLRLSGEHSRNFERRFVGLGSRSREEKLRQPLRQHLSQQLAQLRARRGSVRRPRVGQLLRLLRDGGNHRGIFVPQVHAHQLRREIQIALSIAVGEPAALGIGHVHGVPALLESPRPVVQLFGEFDDLLRGQLAGRRGNGFAHGIPCTSPLQQKAAARHSAWCFS